MIIYKNTKQGFLNEVKTGQIAELLKLLFKNNSIAFSEAEYNSWKNSATFMSDILLDNRFDNELSIYLEYQVFLTSKRVDFLIAGSDKQGNNNLVVVELKQWERCERTGKRDIVISFTGGRRQEVPHPSYQASSYVDLIRAFNKAIDDYNIGIYSCVYLHNYNNNKSNELRNDFYKSLTYNSPIFIKGEEEDLKSYLLSYVANKEKCNIIDLIENSELSPSKSLQDSLCKMRYGTKIFNLIDEQKVVFEQVLQSVKEAINNQEKTVIICQGGAGTGKTVVALNLLFDLILTNKSARYVTHNSSLKNVYKEILKNSGQTLKSLDSLFAGDGQFQESKGIKDNSYDCLLVDESHRVTEHWSNSKDEQHVNSIIRSSKVAVFFIDESQRVTVKDFATVERICESAQKFNAKIIQGEDYNLVSQFRCGGNDGFISFLNNILYESADDFTIDPRYEVKIFKNPLNLKKELLKRNNNNKARMLAGYCYEWVSKTTKTKQNAAKKLEISETDPRLNYDFKLGDFVAKWNLSSDKTWITNPESFDQVGCIHTSQGLELDWVGVIIGKDLRYENGKIITDQNQIAKSDKTSGIRTCKNKQLAKQLILNTYKTLLTRGQKGCYIYCEDKALAEYFLEKLNINYADQENILSNSQKEGLELLLKGGNYFITGEAGSGKSYLLESYIQKIASEKNLLICATTGLAAKYINGKTIHRCFRPPIIPSIITKDTIASDYIIKHISKYDVIVIDEISMCRIDLFEFIMRTIDEAVKLKTKEIQIILCGDFFQLAPVVPENEVKILEALYNTNEGFAFESPEWANHNFTMINLKENMRQGNGEFLKYLNNIRNYNNIQETLKYFNNRVGINKDNSLTAIELHTTNAVVDAYNQQMLNNIPNTEHIYQARIVGEIPEHKYPLKKTIILKEGAKVMCLRNDRNRLYQNGTIGIVKQCLDDGVIISVGEKNIYVDFYTYKIPTDPILDSESKKIRQQYLKASFTQIPLALAYAITVHKSQGQTFEAANFDPSANNFEYLQQGQLYVALSRVKSIAGLKLYNYIKESDWQTSQKVIEFYKKVS